MFQKVFAGILVSVMMLGGIGAGAVTDYSQDANPAIFTLSLPREFYNSARQAYLHSAEMAAG